LITPPTNSDPGKKPVGGGDVDI